MDFRVGNGFDVHAFGVGDSITLCGITIPFKFSLVGHSDADVGLHAIADSIFGALAVGDIGFWFPPSDLKWKNADSSIFLKKATEKAKDLGFRISNIDATFICENPKITPYAKKMRERVAIISQLDVNRVSIKATTSERLGFTGRGEGIACHVTSALIKYE